MSEHDHDEDYAIILRPRRPSVESDGSDKGPISYYVDENSTSEWEQRRPEPFGRRPSNPPRAAQQDHYYYVEDYSRPHPRAYHDERLAHVETRNNHRSYRQSFQSTSSYGDPRYARDHYPREEHRETREEYLQRRRQRREQLERNIQEEMARRNMPARTAGIQYIANRYDACERETEKENQHIIALGKIEKERAELEEKIAAAALERRKRR